MQIGWRRDHKVNRNNDHENRHKVSYNVKKTIISTDESGYFNDSPENITEVPTLAPPFPVGPGGPACPFSP